MFGPRSDDEEMREALRKGRRRADAEERARHAALTYEQRLRERFLKALAEGTRPTKFLKSKPSTKWLKPKPHPWQVEAREWLRQKRSSG